VFIPVVELAVELLVRPAAPSPPGGITASFRRAREILRDEGVRSLWIKFLGETVYRRLLLIEKEIQPPVLPSPEKPELECCRLSMDDVDEYYAFRAYVDRGTIYGRIEQGESCFVVRRRGLIIHACWTATGRTAINYLKCDVQLARDVVYVYEVFTSPQFRGHSISSWRSREMEKYYLANGYRRLLAAVAPENNAVFRSSEKVGYAVAGKMGYWGLGRLRRYFCHFRGGDSPLVLLTPPPPGSNEI
jgi:GNAT superfamily N-acetyltransferase